MGKQVKQLALQVGKVEGPEPVAERNDEQEGDKEGHGHGAMIPGSRSRVKEFGGNARLRSTTNR